MLFFVTEECPGCFCLSFSCFLFKQSRMCAAEDARRTGRRQCLHCTVSTLSSRGRPLGKPAIVFSSRGLITGEVVDGAVALFSTSSSTSDNPIDSCACTHTARYGRRTCRIAFFPIPRDRWLRDRLLDLQLDSWFLRFDDIFYCACFQ